MSVRSRSSEFRFECTRCNGCCGGQPGYVWLSEADLDTLCTHMAMTRREFALAYCKPVDIGLKVTLSLKEKQNFDCIFLGRGGCEVYEARPSQCRTYPFWEAILETDGGWEAEGAECPGIGHGPRASHTSVLEAIQLRRIHPPLDMASVPGLENLADHWGNE